ncbi:MAG: hypothetical protein KF886_22405 [Candidatus Hydrogenedentes bacterium]|nr:hypothetical protein [Candidatus Hydrogenedentota bacterium]
MDQFNTHGYWDSVGILEAISSTEASASFANFIYGAMATNTGGFCGRFGLIEDTVTGDNSMAVDLTMDECAPLDAPWPRQSVTLFDRWIISQNDAGGNTQTQEVTTFATRVEVNREEPTATAEAIHRNYTMNVVLEREYMWPDENLRDLIVTDYGNAGREGFEPPLPDSMSVSYEVSDQVIGSNDSRSIVVTATINTAGRTVKSRQTFSMQPLTLRFTTPSISGDWTMIPDGGDVALDLGAYIPAEGETPATFTPCAMPQVRIVLANSQGLPEGTEFRFIIGGEGQNARAAHYPDVPSTGYTHPGALDSGWLENAAEPDLWDYTWLIDWDINNDVTNGGIFGGHLQNVRAYIRPPGGDEENRDYVAGTTAGFGGIYVVGGALTQNAANSFVSQLTYADFAGFTGLAGNDPPLDQLRTILRAVARHETSDGTHYWYGGNVGHAAHNRYPIREWNPATQQYLAGYGIMQLSEPEMLNRATIWDWQENIKMGAETVIEFYRIAHDNIYAHPVADFATYPVNVSLDVGLRLQTYVKYNGGDNANYYWWNAQGSVVECDALTESTANNFESHSPTVTELSLEIDATLEGLTAISLQNEATQPTVDVVSWPGAMPENTPFPWNGVELDLHHPTENDFVSGANVDHIHIFLAITHNGQTLRHRIHEGAPSPNSVVNSAGFRPPTGWVKMGYIPVGTNTDGFRDYNNDGVRDQAGNVYSIPNWGGAGNPNSGNANRAPRYADHVIALE